MIQKLSRRTFISLGALSAATYAGATLTGCDSNSSSASTSSSTPEETDTVVEESDTVIAVGSSALQPLAQAAAESFMDENLDTQIIVEGGGSGEGCTQISEGAVQIGNSDVFIEEKIDGVDPSAFIDNKICAVGIGPVVNKSVDIDSITMSDLSDIFTGAITNWSEVGGPDADIVVFTRAAGSGTRATFETNVLNGATPLAGAQEQKESGTVLSMIEQTPNSISYLAFSYFGDSIKPLAVDGVKPESESIYDNSWTIWAYEHMYTANPADALTQSFIDYMFSDEVQSNLVPELGYIPTSLMTIERDIDGNVIQL